jgi:hypothetical protein
MQRSKSLLRICLPIEALERAECVKIDVGQNDLSSLNIRALDAPVSAGPPPPRAREASGCVRGRRRDEADAVLGELPEAPHPANRRSM